MESGFYKDLSGMPQLQISLISSKQTKLTAKS